MAPFPYRPMLAILACVVSLMMSQFSIYSYAGFMVKHLGVVDDKDKAGYFTGILSSAFMVGRFVTSYFWGWFADRYGRRIVILIGLWTTVVLSIAFGVSRAFWWAFLSRFLIGALNGIITVSKTSVSEVCGKEHEIVGMGALTMAWSFGIIMGPGLGAFLAEPATHFPSVFSESSIFGRFPFLLANLSVAGFALLALPLVLLFLPASRTPTGGASKSEQIVSLEDLPMTNFDLDTPMQRWAESPGLGLGCVQLRNRRNWEHVDYDKNVNTPVEEMSEVKISGAFTSSQPSVPSWAPRHETSPQLSASSIEGSWSPSPRRKAPASLLEQPRVRLLLITYGIYSFLLVGFDEIFSLWALSSIASGGLNWTSQRIGQVLITVGIAVLLFEMVAVPCITARLGIKLSQRLGSIAEVPTYMIFPMIIYLRGTSVLDVVTVTLLFTTYASSNSFYLAISLAINNSTDAPCRGEVNGLAMTIGSISKAAGPAVCSALFAFSIDGDHPFPVDVHLAWYILAILRFVVGFLGWIAITDDGGNAKKPDGSLDGFELEGIDVDVVDYHEDSSNGTVATRTGFKLDKRVNKAEEEKGE